MIETEQKPEEGGGGIEKDRGGRTRKK